MFNTQVFAGGVQARTIKNHLVEHPVTVTIEGVESELTMADAAELRDGLSAALSAIMDAQSEMPYEGNRLVFGATRYGMSEAPSKLPA